MTFIASTTTVTETAISVPNLSGGTDGKVVRMGGSNTVVDASYNSTALQLNAVLFKQGGIYYATGVVSGLSGLVAGQSYFLGVDGSLVTSPPTPSSTVRALFVGFGINSTTLLFRPGIPISGT